MELNRLLRGLINEEFSDISIYTKEAELFADRVVDGRRIAQVFSAFAREEAEHAQALMKLAGEPGEARPRKIEVGSSLRKCLEMHVRRETAGITAYTGLLRMLDLPEHKLVIKGIIAQETEHLRAASGYLAKLRAADGDAAA